MPIADGRCRCGACLSSRVFGRSADTSDWCTDRRIRNVACDVKIRTQPGAGLCLPSVVRLEVRRSREEVRSLGQQNKIPLTKLSFHGRKSLRSVADALEKLRELDGLQGTGNVECNSWESSYLMVGKWPRQRDWTTTRTDAGGLFGCPQPANLVRCQRPRCVRHLTSGY